MVTKDEPIDGEMFKELSLAQLEGIVLDDPELTGRVHDVLEQYRRGCDMCRTRFEDAASRYEKGDELPPGLSKWSRCMWP